MSKPGEFVPSSTYFEEREVNITREIDACQKKIDEARERFVKQSADLVKHRDEVLDATAILRSKRDTLGKQHASAVAEMVKMHEVITECEKLHAAVAELLLAPMEAVAKLDVEIADIEAQEKKVTARPAHDLDRLKDRLARLQLRKKLAEKEQPAKGPVDLVDMGADSVHG